VGTTAVGKTDLFSGADQDVEWRISKLLLILCR